MTTLAAGRVIAGKYRLLRQLGEGGMGAVWAATHEGLETEVAIKCIVPEHASSEDIRARFQLEARAAAQMKSPHVVQVHDYGVDDGLPYLVMDMLHGEDLLRRLQRQKRLPVAEARALLAQLCKGLHVAHEVGIVHRDLKPANIFLADVHGEEVVKILDFGLAKANRFGKAAELTKSGMLLGTPHYMSPEQARPTGPLDRRSDLWSVAVILFRCLTGRLPFPGEELTEVLVAICADPIPVPSEVDPALSPAIDRFFARALARDPAARFQTALEMAQAFDAATGVVEAPSHAAARSAAEPAFARTLDLSEAAAAAAPAAAVPWVSPASAAVSAGAGASAAVATPSAAVATPSAAASVSAAASAEPSGAGAKSEGTLVPAGRDVPLPSLPRSPARAIAAVLVGTAVVAALGALAVVRSRSDAPPPAPLPAASAPAPTAPPAAAPEPEPTVAPAPPSETASAAPSASAPPHAPSAHPTAHPAAKAKPGGAATAAPGGQPSMFGF